MRLKEAAGLAALSAAGLCAGLLVCEGAARLALPEFEHVGVARFSMGPRADEAYEPSQDLGYERARAAGMDAAGFTTLPGPAAPGARKLVVIGDSLVEHLFGRDGELSFWEKALAGAWSAPVKVWSFGVGGYGMAQYQRVLERRAPSVGPSAVFILFCLNDARRGVDVVFRRSGKLYMLDGKGAPRDAPRWPRLWAASRLYRAAWGLRHRALRMSGEQAADAQAAAVIGWARERGIPLYAAIMPYFKDPRKYTDEERSDHERLKRWLSGARVPTLDLHGVYPAGYWLKYHGADPTDDVHPNEAGYDLARDAILRFLARPATDARTARAGSP